MERARRNEPGLPHGDLAKELKAVWVGRTVVPLCGESPGAAKAAKSDPFSPSSGARSPRPRGRPGWFLPEALRENLLQALRWLLAAPARLGVPRL